MCSIQPKLSSIAVYHVHEAATTDVPNLECGLTFIVGFRTFIRAVFRGGNVTFLGEGREPQVDGYVTFFGCSSFA